MAEFKGAASEGGRAIQLIKRRQKQQEEMLIRKRKIEEDLKIGRIDKKFATHFDSIESELRANTIGLVTLDEMKSKQEDIIKEREKQAALIKLEEDRFKKDKAEKKLNKIKQQASALSFSLNDEDDEEEKNDTENFNDNNIKEKHTDSNDNTQSSYCSKRVRHKYGKDPTIDTSFLPDKDREEEENKLREQLILEWKQKQEDIKNEVIEIVYSYWDGSGHRRQLHMKKGSLIQEFLLLALENLRRDDLTAFPELRTATVDSLMYVKEDIIIPQHYTFYDFIVTKARGKSGPLFSFDVHDDVRLCGDASVDKDETHAGKVVLRSWYDKNKHIFPASRWEPYDPTKKWDNYTIGDHIFK